jgi:hypothetical protein
MKDHQRSGLPWIVGLVLVVVIAADGEARAADPFVRGDVDQSSRLDVSDAVSVLRFLFAGERDVVTCDDAADADDSGGLDTSDAVFLLSALFLVGPLPAAPFPACGDDPTEDVLGCEAYEVCRFAFTFFGQTFDADGVFFVLDRSGRMQDSGELHMAKQEVLKFIEEAPRELRLGIAVFDDRVLKFPSSGMPAEMTVDVKDSASTFVELFPGGVGSCVQSGLLTALDFVQSSGARRNVIIYVGAGGGDCKGKDESTYLNQTLNAITEANQGITAVHAIAVHDVTSFGERFLVNLASRNGGTYTRVR